MLQSLAGIYEGTGEWFDSSGKSSTYTVRQTNAATPDGFEDAIRAIGRIPAVRTTTYDRIVRVDDASDARVGQPR